MTTNAAPTIDVGAILAQALESVRVKDELEHRRILRELYDGAARLRLVLDPASAQRPARVRVRLLRKHERNSWLFAGWITPRGIDEVARRG